MKIFFLLALIPLVGKGIPGSSKVVCSPSTVQAHLGQDAVLSCRVEPPFDLRAETLEWTHGPDNVHLYRSGGDNSDDQDPRFKGRTSLIHQNLKDGNVSLKLTKVTKKDEGNYTFCLPNHGICSNVILTVVLEFKNETHDQTGSTLSPGDITAIFFALVGVVVGGVAVWILVSLYSWRLIFGQILLLF